MLPTAGLSERQTNELALWKKWKVSRSKEVLENLITSFQPMIQQVVIQFSTAPLPPEAVEAEAIKQLVEAFKTYNPGMGTALGTHVYSYLRKVYRYISSYQNIGKIPEARTLRIADFNNVFQQLRNRDDRDPTTNELADALSWNPNEVTRMQSELRKDLSIEDLPYIAAEQQDENLRNTLYFFYNSLQPEDQLIMEYATGLYGKSKFSDKDIAKSMHLPLSVVRKRKEFIVKGLEEAM
jgi:DNA-directed RNA polymerase specialized sigma subunit